ncbi:GntR family transcriptional regulator [Virgibacillus sp. MSJ-26]|uniref:GntR family transcriptional regulator n=1 Tax=Virgibacillus sp. MSJ-26 TaxID=2841522 RepID=UPI001C11FF31|nr:GntR family transcriptional regulator [Virgibacillus sp. MSJ-26]MBU5468592.1 GntR family transcriptional regulator [Virgibacillus sp. MSJ-26]
MKSNKLTLYDQTYEKLRDMIFSGELSNGEKLIETKLAQQLGVSRTPLRESIKRLEQEKLIQNNRISNPTDKDYQDIFELRILIEKYAVTKAAHFFTEEDIKEIEELVKIGYEGNNDDIMNANKQFHEKIVHATKNNLMIDTFSQMQSIVYLFRKTVLNHKRPGLIDEHSKIVTAIKEKDAEKAKQLIEEHLQADLEFGLYYLRT